MLFRPAGGRRLGPVFRSPTSSPFSFVAVHVSASSQRISPDRCCSQAPQDRSLVPQAPVGVYCILASLISVLVAGACGWFWLA